MGYIIDFQIIYRTNSNLFLNQIKNHNTNETSYTTKLKSDTAELWVRSSSGHEQYNVNIREVQINVVIVIYVLETMVIV